MPFTVLRRLDCVLEETKAAVLVELDKRHLQRLKTPAAAAPTLTAPPHP